MSDGPTSLHSRNDKLQLLRRIGLFSNLNTRELRLIAGLTRLVEFKKNEVVYREGEPARAFYVVISGRLRISMSRPSGEHAVATMHRGDSFGESALLTGEAHSATVTALNDTLALTLTKDAFEELIDRIPSLVLYLSRVLSRRLRRRDGRAAEFSESSIIAVHRAVPAIGCTSFALNLASSLHRETRQDTVVVDLSGEESTVARVLGLPAQPPLLANPSDHIVDQEALERTLQAHPSGIHVLHVGHRDDSRSAHLITPLLTNLADRFRFVLVDLPPVLDDLVLHVLVQSDRVFLLTDDSTEHLRHTRTLLHQIADVMQQADDKISIVMNAVQRQGPLTSLDEEERLVGHPIAHVLPFPIKRGTLVAVEELLTITEGDNPYAHAMRRIAREVGKVLVGLALGSGAALGLAHIGVLKVLERERIPVDMIAGASIGALIASFWAIGHSAGELEEIALRFRTRWQTALRLLDVPWLPWRGMFPGHGITRYLRSILGDRTFEDTIRPLRVVATNPFTRETIVYRQGSLVDAVRASVAIPGIFLPVVRHGNVLLDGGVSSPIPVGILRREFVQRIIAVNVFPTTDEMQQLDTSIRRAKAARAEAIATRLFPIRLGSWLRDQVSELLSPSVTQVIMRSMQTMEHLIGEVECQEADVVIRSSTPGASWDQFFQAERFIKRGEEAAEEALPQLTQLLQS